MVMGQQHADELTHGQETPGTAIKRRGILTATAAVVAGIVAKQMSEPVAAAHYALQGDTGLTFYNLANDRTLIYANGPFPAATPVLDVEVTDSDLILGGDLAVGVKGASSRDAGVWGVSSAPSKPGVYGTSLASGTGIGVLGAGDAAGVIGQSSSGIGVQGMASAGIGASFQGRTAPVRLVPGASAASGLSASGHQAGEMYVTSDKQLCYFDGATWYTVLLAPVGGGGRHAPAARPSSASTTTQPVQPIPPPRP
jgi:hypothetical protein